MISTIDDFVSAVANNDTTKLLTFITTKNTKTSSFSVNDADHVGDAAVEVAVTTSNHKLLKLLLDKFKCDPNVSGKRNQTPLRLACRKNDVKSCEILCEFGADVNLTESEKKNNNYKNAQEDQDASDRNKNTDEEADGWTPLHVAVFGMKKNIINLFLGISSSDQENETEDEEAKKKKQDQRNKNKSLITDKLDLTIRTKREGATVLHFAAAQGLSSAVKAIIELQLSKNSNDISCLINIQDNQGDTALHSAFHYRMAKTLGGRYSPPEVPQWSIVLTLAFYGANLMKNPRSGEVSPEDAFYYVYQKNAGIKNVLVAVQECGKILGQTGRHHQSSSSSSCFFIDYTDLVKASSSKTTTTSSIEGLQKYFETHFEKKTLDDKNCQEALQRLHSAIVNELEPERQQNYDEAVKKIEEMKQNNNNNNSSNDKNIDPHGLGIDVRTIKPGEDPSNGECPFLAARAKSKKDENNSTSNNKFDAGQLICVGTMMFIAGFSLGTLFGRNYNK